MKRSTRIARQYDIDSLIVAVQEAMTDTRRHEADCDTTSAIVKIYGSGASGIYQTMELCDQFGICVPKRETKTGCYGELALNDEYWEYEIEPVFAGVADILSHRVSRVLNQSITLWYGFSEGFGDFCLFASWESGEAE